MKPTARLLAALACAAPLYLTLPGCAPVLVGGTAVGVSMIHDRRTAADVIQ